MNFSKMRRCLVGALSTCILLSAVAPVYADTDLGNDDPLKNNQNQFRTVEDKSFTVETKTTSQWTGHSNLEFVFTNAGSETIHDWYFTFDFDYAIENPYNCYIVEQKDNLYTIGNNDWNQDIHPGESVTIGFTASSDDDSDIEKMPSFYLLNTETYTLTADELSYSFEEYSNWNEGFTGAIVLSNNTEDSIRDWSISFSSNKALTLSDSSILTDNSDGSYTIVNDGFSQNITSGQSFRFGIQGGENDPSVSLELSDYSATATKLAFSLDDDKNENGVLDVLETDFNPISVVVPTEEPTEVPTEEPTPDVTVTPEPTVTVEPTPVIVKDPYIKLKCDEDEFLTDVASQRIGFFAQTNITVSYIELVDGEGKAICYLYDDGNYTSHNDDIGGDGIYSGKANINTSSECTYEFKAVANYDAKTIISNVKEVCVYKFLTDQDWENMDAVNEAIQVFLNDPELYTLNHEEKIEAAITFLTDISNNGVEGYDYSLVIPGSIIFSEADDNVHFLYDCGIEGVISVEPFDPELAGDTPTTTPTPAIVPTPIPTPSPTSTPTPTAVPTPSVTPAIVPTPTHTPPVPNTNTNYSGEVIILYAYTNISDSTQPRDVLDAYEDFADGTLDDLGLDTRIIPNFTVDDLRKCFTDKELIVVGTHGCTDNGVPVFLTNNMYSADRDKTNKDASARRIAVYDGNSYEVKPSFIRKYYSEGQLLEGSVFMYGSCKSYGTSTNLSSQLCDAAVDCGAKGAIGYECNVYQHYPRCVFEKFVDSYIANNLSIQQSFDNATSSLIYMDNDDNWFRHTYSSTLTKDCPAIPHLVGGDTSYVWTGTNSLMNGGFEWGFLKWNIGGDSRVISQLGSDDETIYPLEGEKMAIITTGTGSGESAYLSGSNESYIKHSVSFFNANSHLTFSYNMISEEVTEYVGSYYDDSFVVYAILKDGTKVELERNSINTATWLTGSSNQLTTINFPDGDNTVYQTGWIFCDIDLSDVNPLNIEEIVFAVTDVGDSLYDTVVLIDDVEFD